MKIYRYLMVNFLLIAFSACYAGNNYFINFYNNSAATITITPSSHYCVYAYSAKPIVITANHSSGIKLRSNNSGFCAFEFAEEQFNFSTNHLTKGWIDFFMGGGIYNYRTTSSGHIDPVSLLDGGGVTGRDDTDGWTLSAIAGETASVEFL